MHLINERHRTASKLLQFSLSRVTVRGRERMIMQKRCAGERSDSLKKKKVAAAATSGWGST